MQIYLEINKMQQKMRLLDMKHYEKYIYSKKSDKIQLSYGTMDI